MIADSNSGLEESSVMLKAKNVTIDNRGPKKTTMNVAKLENKNLSKILLISRLFFVRLTIFLASLLQIYINFLPRVTTKS